MTLKKKKETKCEMDGIWLDSASLFSFKHNNGRGEAEANK